MKVLILALSLLMIGAAALRGQEHGLDFLKNIPEFRDLSLEISEAQLKANIADRALYVRKEAQRDRQTYWVLTPSGENILVGFQNGKCTGIQRMQPIPETMIQEDIGEAEYREWMAKRSKSQPQ